MRRIALIFALAAGCIAAVVTTSASGDDTRTYYIELDNAFGLTTGSEVKVAGVAAGEVTDFFINSEKRAIAKVELSGPVAVLGEGTICSSEPQSLIAEYFIDCTPKGDPIELTDMSEEEHAENPDIPVAQTRQTVQQDLVLSTLRLPFRERLGLLINEFGTALAGNSENLNSAIRRGAPALRETQKVFDLLAEQNTIIRDLNVDSDTIITKLADRRADVVDWIEETKDTAGTSAAVRDELGQNFALLDDFLAELRPTMVELNDVAETGTPLARNLRLAAPGLTELSRNLPNFNPAATDAVVSLGKSSVVGERALRKGRDEVRQLSKSSKKSFAVSDALAKFLRDIDDPGRAVEADARANKDTGRTGETGYTGLEALLNYTYYQPLAINQFDEIGHLLHFSIFEVETGPCANYNPGQYDPDGPGPQDAQPGVPNADGSAATSSILEANRCVAWLGPNQPGINQDVPVEPYDPSVCPEGSTDLAICDPNGPSTTSFGRGNRSSDAESGFGPADAGEETSDSADDGGETGTEGTEGTEGDGSEAPVAPGVPEVPGLPGLGGDAGEVIPGVTDDAAANHDLLDYLFGS